MQQGREDAADATIGGDKPVDARSTRACPAASAPAENMHSGRVDRVPASPGTSATSAPTRSSSSCGANSAKIPGVRAIAAGAPAAWCAARPAAADRAGRPGLRASWRSGATACSRAWRQNPGLHRRRLRLQGNPAAAARDRSTASAPPTSACSRADDRPHAADDARLAPRHHLRRRGRGIRRRACRPSASDRATPDRPRATSTCAAASGELVPLSSAGDAAARSPKPGSLNRFNRLRAITISARPRARLPAGRGDRLGAAGRRARNCPSTAQIDYKRRSRASTCSRGGAVLFTFAHGAADRVPGAGGAVRELHPSAGDHADGAAGGARRAARPVR